MADDNALIDELLFERFRQEGDRQALETLFERHVGIVSGLCAKMLSADQRAALVLHYAGGLSRSKIAKALAKPEGTVASWLTGGLGKLNAMMRARGHAVPKSIVLSCLPVLSIPSFVSTLQLTAAKAATQAILPATSFLKIAGLFVALGSLLLVVWAIAPLLRAPKDDVPPPTAAAAGAEDQVAARATEPDARLVVQLGHDDLDNLAIRESADSSVVLRVDTSERKLSLRDAMQPSDLLYKPEMDVADVAIAPDGKTLTLWDLEKGAPVASHALPVKLGMVQIWVTLCNNERHGVNCVRTVLFTKSRCVFSHN
ncbi:MAG: sigma factor-like helix-turn-helix DNA-binding protein [Planctomycetota bacterium]